MQKNADKIIDIEENKARFAVWTVGGEEYKLKLRTQEITMLEDKLGENLMIFLSKNKVPKLKDMALITMYARRPYDRTVSLEAVYKLFDKYFEEGGSQTEFTAGPFMDLFKVSGFFSSKMETRLEESQAEVQKLI